MSLRPRPGTGAGKELGEDQDASATDHQSECQQHQTERRTSALVGDDGIGGVGMSHHAQTGDDDRAPTPDQECRIICRDKLSIGDITHCPQGPGHAVLVATDREVGFVEGRDLKRSDGFSMKYQLSTAITMVIETLRAISAPGSVTYSWRYIVIG